MADQAQADPTQTANYAYAIVRSNLLSAPEQETLGNSFLRQCFLAFTSVTSALEVF